MFLPLRVMMPLFALAMLAGCNTDGDTPANPKIPTGSSSALLRPGDSLTVALQGVPDPSVNQVQIDDQGIISLPYIGTLSASGATPGELGQRIRETYVAKKIYNVVDVSVSVTERFARNGRRRKRSYHPTRPSGWRPSDGRWASR